MKEQNTRIAPIKLEPVDYHSQNHKGPLLLRISCATVFEWRPLSEWSVDCFNVKRISDKMLCDGQLHSQITCDYCEVAFSRLKLLSFDDNTWARKMYIESNLQLFQFVPL